MEENTRKVVVRLARNALDDIPMGIVRIDTARHIAYMNSAARSIFGEQITVGANLSEIPMGAESRHELDANLTARQGGQGSVYELELLSPRWRTQTLVEVTGVPEYDDDDNIVGSVGFLRNRSFESANLNVHLAIEESATWQDLLRRLAAELHKVIAFDSFLVTLVSEERRHLRSLFEDPPFEDASPIRWWPMPPFVRAMLADITATSQLSVEEMFDAPDFRELLRRDRPTRIWKERGFRYLLRRPVFHKGVLVAVVLLERHADEPFTEQDLRTFDELPVAEAVNIALALDNRGEMQFRLDLIRDLGRLANDADALRATLVERLRRNYSWEHVSLFRVDKDREKLRLVCQSALPGRELREDYSQPLNAGLLGAVRKTRRPVIVGNVKEDPRHLKAVPGTHSEMCLPIPGSRLRWILNVESELIDAFAEEEQRSVELVLEVVGFLLDRVETIEMNSAIFDSVADGVILTSLNGQIQRVNPALLRMLGRTEADLLGQNLTNLIVPPGKATAPEGFGDKILKPRVHALRVDLKWKRARKAVLLSGAELPREVGGRFYLANDVAFAERLEQMEALKRVFSSIAAEMRIPLSLACSFLGEISKEGANARELAGKALAQLRRADLPLERILRLATLENREELPITEVDVTQALERITSELPRSQAGDVQLHVTSGVRQVKAAYSELAFCMQSIVAFLLRQKAQADELHIGVSQNQRRVLVDFWLAREKAKRESPTEIAPLDRNVREFALADTLIASLMGRMGGKYEPRGMETRFRLSLAS